MEKQTKEQEEDNLLKRLGIAFLIVLAIGSLFEVGLLVYAFVNADRVECNLLWCSFISEDSYQSINSYTSVSSTSECFVNGERVNCSEFNGDEHFCSNGICSINGVCGGDYNSNLKCIEDIIKQKGGLNSSQP